MGGDESVCCAFRVCLEGKLVSRTLHFGGAIFRLIGALTLTCYWSFVWSVQSWRTRIVTYGVKDPFSIRHDVELQCRILDAVRVVAINPSAFRNVLAATIFGLYPSSWFDAVVPRLAALIANVAGPGSARALIVLLYCDPGDTCRIVVVRNADVAGIQPGRILVDDLFADSAGIDLAPLARARVAVARIESIYAINGTAL